ncbi:MAG TPA: ABC transporter permease [Bryobacteraceae bacterium]|nr:ABC transporter permease [Bryobacteraceae bacterium]
MRQWWSRFRAWVTGRQGIAEDLAEEIQSNLQMKTESYIERGMAPEKARAAARRHFGNTTGVAESARDAWGFSSLESLFMDVRYGFRAMRRAPAFSVVVILTFALGVGVNTAIFSVVNAVLLKPLPYPDSERLVRLGEATAKADFSVSWGNFKYWRESNHTFEDMAAYQFTGRTLTGHGDPTTTSGLMVTAPFFPLLGMRPLLGRLFDQADDRPGAPAIIVLNHRFWSSQLGGDPHIVGANLTLNGTPFEVAGVAAPLWEPWRVDYYLPLGQAAGAAIDRRQHGSIRAIGLLKPGVALASARADLDAIMRHLAEVDPSPENDHHSFGAFLTEDIVGDVRRTLIVLMGAAALILLIACANVASLLLARNTARASELALRKAIGAGQLRLVRQLFTENILIAAVGGAAGVAFGYWGLRLLIGIAPRNIPRLAETTLALPVLLFACGITLGAGLLAGLAPVLVAGKIDLATALKEGARLSGGGTQRQAFRNILVVAEVALTFVLAFGSGLLLRSLAAAQTTSPGFDPLHVLSLSLQLTGKAYRSPEAIGAFYTSLLTDLRTLPGVIDARAVHCPPPAGDCGDWFYSVLGRPLPPRDDVPISLFNTADAGYFRMMRVPLLQGREFTGSDRATGPKIAVVNETFARAWWPSESAVGHQIKVGGPYQDGDLLEIVGVAGDIRQFGLDSKPMPEIFRPSAQQPGGSMAVMVRTAADPVKLMRTVRSRVSALDRDLPLRQFGPLEESLGAGLARRRFSTLLLTLFAGLAMLLAAVGIYGLLSYWVTSREPEIAIRLALGACPSTILRWASFHALRLAVMGVALGVLGGWAAARLLDDLVFGIKSRNPATMAAAALAVTVIALFATAVPAWRAARVDAARRLHHT